MGVIPMPSCPMSNFHSNVYILFTGDMFPEVVVWKGHLMQIPIKELVTQNFSALRNNHLSEVWKVYTIYIYTTYAPPSCFVCLVANLRNCLPEVTVGGSHDMYTMVQLGTCQGC